MKRRQFIQGTAALIGASFAPELLEAGTEDVSAVKQVIVDYYRVYYTDLDKTKYRSLLAEDYLLLENGAIFDAEKDVSLIPTPDAEYRRTDSFDFRLVKIHGETAYAVYFLKSDIKDKKDGARKREYLESAVLRRGDGSQWRIALLHSTKLANS